jgi:hypothetical protein
VIIVPGADGQLSAGPEFKDLKNYQRCPPN